MGLFGIGNIVKIGGLLIAGLLGYTLIKNAGSIGSSVGSFVGTGLGQGISGIGEGLGLGFSTTLSGLSQSWNDAWASVDIFGGTPNRDTAGAMSVGDPNVEVPNTNANVGVVAGNPEEEGFHPIATPFKGFVSSGSVSEEFAQQYSFSPPAQAGQLDVSDTFAYIGSEQYRNLSQASQANTNALASAIAESANRYPEWFA
jgi:hypothetical protein